jgi:hypothetical protein
MKPECLADGIEMAAAIWFAQNAGVQGILCAQWRFQLWGR